MKGAVAGWSKRLRRLAAPAVLLCLAFGLSALGAAQGMGLLPGADDSESAPPTRPLVLSARDLASQGRWDGAERLLRAALEVDGSDPDALYLMALASLKAHDDASAALYYAEASLSSGRKGLYEAGSVVDLKASLLNRLRRYRDCLGFLAAAAQALPAGGNLDPEYLRSRILASVGLGLRAEALKDFQLALSRFPDDPAFARLFFERFATATPSKDERAVGELLVRRLGRLAALDPGLLALAAPFILDPKARLDSLRAYRAQGGTSAQASLLALEYGLIPEQAALDELFSGAYPLTLGALAKADSLIGHPEGRARFLSLLGGFSGTILADRDGDGWFEERATYAKGLLTGWTRDEDQDGHADLALSSLSEGLPLEFRVVRHGRAWSFRYSAYPHVESLGTGDAMADSALSDMWRFGPDALVYAPLAFRPFPSASDKAIFLPEPVDAALPTEVAAMAAALEYTSFHDGYRDVVSLDAGVPQRRSRFVDGRLLAVLDYRGGRPGTERLDTDGDGRFETERGYRAGSQPSDEAIAWTEVDADGDGVHEYREEAGPPPKKEWDLDGNGSWDAILTALPDGGRRLDLSSSLDGRLDESISFDAAGRILSLTRRGAVASLLPDANPLVRWIGRKPFDLGRNLPEAAGIYSYMKARYRLVYVGSEAFAELLP
jgi:tetratricopeptide (TPR) repeat protein